MQIVKENGLYENNRIQYIAIEKIRPNPGQPRKLFDQESLNELADSISKYGILQPLSVRKKGDAFELIAGERRLRASKIAGLKKVPCIVLGVSNEQSSILTLIENIQRRDLDFIEEAEGIARLILSYGLSQEEAARKIGKSQSAVANKLRILKHSRNVLDLLRQHGLTERHARALLRLETEQDKLDAIQQIVECDLNVADTEELIERMLNSTGSKAAKKVSRTFSFIIKDIRIFENTIKHAIAVMRDSGLDADYGKEEDERSITLTIKIPKRAS
ncbi:MAG: ParB/RepB/Spo0J family partition protein [Eubacteriales bacterium]|jgi:ParB family chromosome partitioning protein